MTEYGDNIEIENLNRQYFESIKTSDIFSNLKTLEELIRKEFDKSHDFNKTLENVLTRLNQCGHNLARLEYDSDIYRFREVWGTNYQDCGANGLQMEVIGPNNVYLTWVITTQNIHSNKD